MNPPSASDFLLCGVFLFFFCSFRCSCKKAGVCVCACVSLPLSVVYVCDCFVAFTDVP